MLHNQRAAEQIFGREHMDAKRQSRQRGQHMPAQTSSVPAPSSTAAAANVVASPPLSQPNDPRSPREIVRGALIGMGFRDREADRAVQAMLPSEGSRPIELLVRDAILLLT